MNKIRRIIICMLAFSLLGMATMFAQSRENRWVRVINRSSSSIRYLYASNVDRKTWEEDILGAFRVITPDHYMDVNIDDGSGHCYYDLRAVLSDGREAITNNVNVCSNDTWTVRDSN